MTKVIGLASQKRMGKDSLANFLIPRLSGNWSRRNWADGLKKAVCDIFGVTLEFIENWKENPELPPGWLMPMRKVLQTIGDGMRQIKGDCWIEYSFANPDSRMMFVDGRYISELQKVKTYSDSTNIAMYRPCFLNDSFHPSESQIGNIIKWYIKQDIEGPTKDVIKAATSYPEGAELIDLFIWNDGDLDDLRWKIDTIILPYLEEKNDWNNL